MPTRPELVPGPIAGAMCPEVQTAPSPRRRSWKIALAVLLWTGGVGGGLGSLLAYSATPGRPAAPQGAWPSDTSIARAPVGATLVLLIHPHCACSKATIHQLADLLTHHRSKMQATVLFIRPEGFESGWERGELWDAVAAIDGAFPVADPLGVEARRFGAYTSGQAILYSNDGRVLFTGGLTASRGHEGGSAGVDAIVALLHGASPTQSQTPVFGCPLWSPDAFMEKEAQCHK